MDKPKFRHEIKHFINSLDGCILRTRLKQIMSPDTFALEDGKYKIRSLYFDNFNDKALLEKLDGLNNREKFRIRFYNDDHSFIKLEKKSKTRGLCLKDSVQISYENCKRIVEGDIAWMSDSNNPLLLELYIKMQTEFLRPKTVVDYTREAYMYKPGNVRITIDSNIKTGIFSKDLLNPNLPTIGMYPPGYSILEVKFDEFLPEIISDMLQTNEHRSTSVSKYAACRIYG
ncbi:polyphosphate polymerase domain-containing protein [Alkaliphilus sp. B6464]|uniref:polyphosphate polymerase domain-containing protein n=1 Tax=Alkaliphilus sp. B6464 TaxID=2731219 RepID=UPI001BAA1E80|nr:polyphosphate polymerase domain-containing protein [Alkaliphilus sp. B6464]QUH19736.1 polyphosphate polymerase domain-containing protein [Alkaliphilus sp. B6464]